MGEQQLAKAIEEMVWQADRLRSLLARLNFKKG